METVVSLAWGYRWHLMDMIENNKMASLTPTNPPPPPPWTSLIPTADVVVPDDNNNCMMIIGKHQSRV
jgi:hypothetical protein